MACLPEQEKIRANHGTDLNHYSVERSAPHLYNRAQTSNKAHDKFVPLRDCACADHSRPSRLVRRLVFAPCLNRAHDRSLPHLVIIRFRLTPPLSQAPLLGQDELTRRKRDLDTRGLSVRLHTFIFPQSQTLACLSANLFPSNFDSKAIWHFSASRFGCCRNPN